MQEKLAVTCFAPASGPDTNPKIVSRTRDRHSTFSYFFRLLTTFFSFLSTAPFLIVTAFSCFYNQSIIILVLRESVDGYFR